MRVRKRLSAFLWRARRWLARRWFSWRDRVPSRGPCGHCGKPVHHCYPWWTKNPALPGAQPLHNECARDHLFSEEECADG